RAGAAYALGHDSRILRRWQKLFHELPWADDAEHGVPLTLESLEQARFVLADLIHPTIYQALGALLRRLSRMNTRRVGARNAGRQAAFAIGQAPGERDWQKCCSLVDRSLRQASDLGNYLSLGVMIAELELACDAAIDRPGQDTGELLAASLRKV